MRFAPALCAAFALTAPAAAIGAETPATEVTLTLKDHRFTPEAVTVPAGARIRIQLINEDPASEEFDSDDLRVEKDVTPNGRITFSVGPLKPGVYSFMGELHADTASGQLKAVAAE